MRLAILFLLLLSSPAFAFSQQGNTATLLLFVGLGCFVLANLLLQIIFYFAGKYQSPIFAKKHVRWSLVPCLLMLIVSVLDYSGLGPLMMNLGGILIAAAFALLPYQLSNFKPQNTMRPWLLSTGAAIYLVIGAFLAPVNIFAIAAGHVALSSSPKLKALNIVILLSAYGLLGYWLWQTAQAWV